MSEGVILLVEDNPDDEALTLRALQRSGIAPDVVVSRDGAEALDWLFQQGVHARRPPGAPRLVLLDLKLPRVSGLEVLQRLRADARTRLVPVVILTSSREEHDLASCYASGANSYIRKPVRFDAFTEAVRELGAYWLELNEPPPR